MASVGFPQQENRSDIVQIPVALFVVEITKFGDKKIFTLVHAGKKDAATR